jgi:hypothetical protein
VISSGTGVLAPVVRKRVALQIWHQHRMPGPHDFAVRI